MNSIRTKVTVLTVCAIIITMIAATALSVFAIRGVGDANSDQMLLLLCETGEKNLDSYFESVEQSVEMAASFAESDIEGIDDKRFGEHVVRMRGIFADMANQTQGVLTYYYRINPDISKTEKGFWYVNLDGKKFQEHEPTDISSYDVTDTSQLVWFTVPKATGRAVWLPPYITDNLDVRVLSYNVPIYWKGMFVGVVGIEIDYSTMAGQVDNIKLYDNGYAFINDAEGNLVYHPRMDVAAFTDENRPKLPSGLLGDSTFVRYAYDGVEKQAVWLPLSNGMRLNVTVPIAEINAAWLRLMYQVFGVAVLLVLAFSLLTMHLTGRITKPLRELTDAAEQVDHGNYDFKLAYAGNDEVGILTRAFNKLVSHLKVYISDLNSLAYADALTSVRNKGAFDIYIRELQARIDDPDDHPEFAIAIFDCDGLKSINDRFGHDKGDTYIKNACYTICHVFQHSSVFRIGGDEFAAIIQNDDYQAIGELTDLFRERSVQFSANTSEEWEQVRVSVGVAVYDEATDESVDDVVRHADKLMYEDKRARKAGR